MKGSAANEIKPAMLADIADIKAKLPIEKTPEDL